MQDRMKLRSVSFSDDPQPPALPARNRRSHHHHHRKQSSMESLPLYGDTDPIYGPIATTKGDPLTSRLNSLPRMMPHHRRKILDFNNRPSSSLAGESYNFKSHLEINILMRAFFLAGHYQYLGDPVPDYANLTSISRRSAGICRQSSLKDNYYDVDQYAASSVANQQPALLADHFQGDFQRGGSSSLHNGVGYFLNAPGTNEDSGSPYSPGTASYGTENSFSSLSRSGTSILKNGSAALRTNGRNRPTELHSNVLRPLKQQQYYSSNNNAQDGGSNTFLDHEETSFYNNTTLDMMAASSSSSFYNNSNGRQYSDHHTTNGYDVNGGHHHIGVSGVSSRFSDDAIDASISLNNHINNMNNLKDSTQEEKPPEEAYPTMAKPSPSLQIIATRNRPCCECIRADQRGAPVCLLFLIFIVVSISVISGVMIYLKSGNYRKAHAAAAAIHLGPKK